MKTKLMFFSLLLLFTVTGCATSINNIAEHYAEDSAAIKDFARISADDWLFGSGIIQGALPEEMVPAWVFEELQAVDAWFVDHEELNDWQLGYMIGLRLRMAGPILRAAVEQYAPGILGIQQVSMVLAFIGL